MTIIKINQHLASTHSYAVDLRQSKIDRPATTRGKHKMQRIDLSQVYWIATPLFPFVP